MPQPVRLGVLVGKKDPVIEQFVRVKSRVGRSLSVEIMRTDIPEGSTTDDALTLLRSMSQETDAVIVQLPLIDSLDTDTLLGHIPAESDADAMNPRVDAWHHIVNAPVALAVAEILQRSSVPIDGARVVVVGNGRLVGAPCAAYLQSLGAAVKIITREEGSFKELKHADILVLGAGSPGLITPDMIKEGCAVIDAGTSEQGGSIKGDAAPECAEKAAVFTPVPGGVGPVAVAMLFKNVLDLTERKNER
jgi:methylenetetrahydrofolate dehydrogenase (NADP+)/methenyltetrahydrofolate cyclohydrolase